MKGLNLYFQKGIAPIGEDGHVSGDVRKEGNEKRRKEARKVGLELYFERGQGMETEREHLSEWKKLERTEVAKGGAKGKVTVKRSDELCGETGKVGSKWTEFGTLKIEDYFRAERSRKGTEEILALVPQYEDLMCQSDLL
jgi:hypothetical protein